MDWVVGGMTILAMELIARKMWQGWAVGLVNQVLWAYLVVYQGKFWGLGVVCVILTWRYSVALMRWRNE